MEKIAVELVLKVFQKQFLGRVNFILKSDLNIEEKLNQWFEISEITLTNYLKKIGELPIDDEINIEESVNNMIVNLEKSVNLTGFIVDNIQTSNNFELYQIKILKILYEFLTTGLINDLKVKKCLTNT